MRSFASVLFALLFFFSPLHSRAEPQILVSAVETNASKDPKLQTKMTCTIDDTGKLTQESVVGFNEDDQPLKVENKEKILPADVIPQLKRDLTAASRGGYILLDHSCDIGTTVVEGLNPERGEMFDIFVARNCVDTLINNRIEVQSLLKRFREWCGMKLVRPRLRGASPARYF